MPFWSDMYLKVTHVYHLYDADNNLLYIGLSNEPNNRVRHHMRRQPWGHLISSGTFERFETRADAQQAEWNAIRSDKPRYNISRPQEVWV